MASKVFANKNAVATTTSGHVASNVDGVYDVRDQEGTEVERLSFVPSTELKVNRSAITRFDGGWVWRQSSEAGPSSMSEADDELIGVVSGATNGKVMLAVGAGSPNVYVEKERVGCHTHETRQNMLGDVANSPGKILDAAELAKEQERYRARQRFLAAERARKAAEAARQQARERIRDIVQTQEEPAEPNTVAQQTPKPKGITAVVIKDGARVQGEGAPTDSAGPILEVVRGATVEILVDGDAPSTIVLPDGSKVDGPTASYRVPSTIALNASFGARAALANLGFQGLIFGTIGDLVVDAIVEVIPYTTKSITVAAKEGGTGQFSREVLIVSDVKFSAGVSFGGFDVAKIPFIGKLVKIAEKGSSFGLRELKILEGSGALKASWEPRGDHRVALALALELGLTLISGRISYEIDLIKFFPGGIFVKVALELAEALDIQIAKLFIEVSLSASIGLEGSRTFQLFVRGASEREPSETAIVAKGNVTLGIALKLELLGDRVKGAAGASFGVEVTWPLLPPGELDLEPKGELFLSLTIDIGIFEFEGRTSFPLSLADFGL